MVDNSLNFALMALSPVPTFRRVMSVPDSISDENWGRAAGTLGLDALYAPADIRDAWTLGKAEVRSIMDGAGPIRVQTNGTFLNNTFLNSLRLKNNWNWLDNILSTVDKYDKTFAQTDFGKNIL